MNIEFEATFEKIDKDDIRNRLNKAGAKLEKKEFLQKRITFCLPKGHDIKNGVEITIDEWPFLEPIVEVEGKSEQEVKDIANKL